MPAAVLHHLMVIDEAISRLSGKLRERHPEVPWRQILRDTATGDIPELHQQVLNILIADFSESESD